MLTLSNLTVGFGPRILLRSACATLRRGELVALLGRNGTGKSTLLRAIAGLQAPLSGQILFDGTSVFAGDAAARSRTAALVGTERVRVAHLRVREVVELGRAPYTPWNGRLSAGDRIVVSEALETVGATALAERPMSALSDGEAQRVMIARALAQATPLVLLDEPTAFLDLPSRYELMALLGRLAHEHDKCVLFSTHDLEIARQAADRLLLIDPPVLEESTADDVLERFMNR